MKKEKHKLTIQDWNNGIWGNRDLFFENLEDAKKHAKKEKGKIKIYNGKGHLMHSEHKHDHNTYA
jgi:proline dehydrogenase